MAKEYLVDSRVRIVNNVMAQLLRWGVPLPNYFILTVRGRKSGQAHSLPVIVLQENGQRWLVSPYGEVNWVKNARAAGEVTLLRGGKSETVRIRELDMQERAPILKLYATKVPITRPYFAAPFDAPIEVFAAEASQHPVFQLE